MAHDPLPEMADRPLIRRLPGCPTSDGDQAQGGATRDLDGANASSSVVVGRRPAMVAP